MLSRLMGLMLCLAMVTGCYVPPNSPEPSTIDWTYRERTWERVITPDGNEGIAFKCDNIMTCTKKAGSLCPSGYNILASQAFGSVNYSSSKTSTASSDANSYAVAEQFYGATSTHGSSSVEAEAKESSVAKEGEDRYLIIECLSGEDTETSELDVKEAPPARCTTSSDCPEDHKCDVPNGTFTGICK